MNPSHITRRRIPLRRWSGRLALVPALVAVAALSTACGSDSPTSDGGGDATSPSAPTSATATGSAGADAGAEKIAVNISGDTVTPNGDTIDAKVGVPIELDVTSDAAGEIHVHSDPENEFEVTPGANTFTFTIDRPGIVEVESHTLDKVIMQLKVQ